jgi:hypothetical protein
MLIFFLNMKNSGRARRLDLRARLRNKKRIYIKKMSL